MEIPGRTLECELSQGNTHVSIPGNFPPGTEVIVTIPEPKPLHERLVPGQRLWRVYTGVERQCLKTFVEDGARYFVITTGGRPQLYTEWEVDGQFTDVPPSRPVKLEVDFAFAPGVEVEKREPPLPPVDGKVTVIVPDPAPLHKRLHEYRGLWSKTTGNEVASWSRHYHEARDYFTVGVKGLCPIVYTVEEFDEHFTDISPTPAEPENQRGDESGDQR